MCFMCLMYLIFCTCLMCLMCCVCLLWLMCVILCSVFVFCVLCFVAVTALLQVKCQKVQREYSTFLIYDISLITTRIWYWFKHYSLYSLIAWKCVQLTCIYVCSVPRNFMVSKNVKLFPVEVQCLPNFGKLDLSCMETCPYYLLFHVILRQSRFKFQDF